jgi:hypothetical protein
MKRKLNVEEDENFMMNEKNSKRGVRRKLSEEGENTKK